MAREELIGHQVRTSDGYSLGKVVRCTDTELLTVRGWLFRRRFVIPFDEMAADNPDTIYLRRTANEVRARFSVREFPVEPVERVAQVTDKEISDEYIDEEPVDVYPGIGLPVAPSDEKRMHTQEPPPSSSEPHSRS
jgi:hypothetical protein